jgi:hypothetical protein
MKDEYTGLMPGKSPFRLSPLEQSCMEFNHLVRDFHAAPRYSKQGIVILRKIHEVRARLASQLPQAQPSTVKAGPIAASAEPEPPLVRKPLLAISWRAVTVEARFVWDALSRDLGVAIPFGSFLTFDVVVTTKANNYRVQVKYTTFPRTAGWIVNVQRAQAARQEKGDFDILAVLAPDDAWYIIPFAALKGRKAIRLPRRPQVTKNQKGFSAARYRERWDLFK